MGWRWTSGQDQAQYHQFCVSLFFLPIFVLSQFVSDSSFVSRKETWRFEFGAQ